MRKPTRIELYNLAKRGARSPLPEACLFSGNFSTVHDESWSERELLARFGLDGSLLESLAAQSRSKAVASDASDSEC
eukprot:1168577-Pyramimonas_sp.AAC.1